MTAGRKRLRKPHPWLLAGLGVAALAFAGYLAYRVLTRESSTPASVADAIARFRALPPSHRYPARTTIAVSATPHGCVSTRWDVLATRWDGMLACPRADGGWRLLAQREEHEFVNHVDRRTYRCTPASTARLVRPARLTAGARWRSRCAIAGTTTSDTVTLLGPRTLTLDGRQVRTLLLRTRTRVSGETTGVGTTFSWVLPRSGLVVRRTLANASSTDTLVGAVRYEEVARLTLTSPRPRR
jgi:hypothetical protein